MVGNIRVSFYNYLLFVQCNTDGSHCANCCNLARKAVAVNFGMFQDGWGQSLPVLNFPCLPLATTTLDVFKLGTLTNPHDQDVTIPSRKFYQVAVFIEWEFISKVDEYIRPNSLKNC